MDYNNLVDVSEFDYLDTTGASMDPSSLLNITASLAKYSIVGLGLSILLIVELWMIFKKCGKPGWAAIVPIYNMWVLFEICELPGWLCLIPVANVIGMFVSYFKLPKKFDKSSVFGLGILFLPYVFLGILAFSKKADNENVSTTTENNLVSSNIPENVPTDSTMNVQTVSESQMPIPEMESISNAAPDLMAVNNEPVNPGVINEVVPEKQFVEEAPALNVEEPEMPSLAVNVENNNETQPSQDVNLVNAFEMPSPSSDNVLINDINNNDSIAAVDNNIQNIEQTPINNDTAPVNEVLTENPTPEVLSTETLVSVSNSDVPQMVNEAINNDITVVKKCPNCGFDNKYVNKNCENCGNVLE